MSRILMVDDSPTEIAVVKGILEGKGHMVLTASSGAEGIALAKAEKPDLIFMDIVMPDMNGFKATREISGNSDTASIPVIVMSSKGQKADMEWAKRQGATDYLVKPVHADAITAAVEKVLSQA